MHRYHSLLVTLHWLVALLIIALLFAGEFLLSQTPNTAPAKIITLRAHMSAGTFILLLMVVRLLMRLAKGPAMAAGAGATIWQRAEIWMHWALYTSVGLVAISGMMLAVQAGALPAVLGKAASTALGDVFPSIFSDLEASLPATFAAFPAARIHALFCDLLNVLILGHVAAFLWHVWADDVVIGRMWYRRRKAVTDGFDENVSAYR